MTYQLWRNVSYTEGEIPQPLFLEKESDDLESLKKILKENPGHFTITNKTNNTILEN